MELFSHLNNIIQNAIYDYKYVMSGGSGEQTFPTTSVNVGNRPVPTDRLDALTTIQKKKQVSQW